MRKPRVKTMEIPAKYRVSNKAADYVGSKPLKKKGARRRLLDLILFSERHFFCTVSSIAIDGDSFTFIVEFEALRKLSRSQLERIAADFYPGPYKPYKHWNEKDWRRFNRRLFDISEFMKCFEMRYAIWHNRVFDRTGHFWAQRFHSVMIRCGFKHILEEMQSQKSFLLQPSLFPQPGAYCMNQATADL